MHTSWQGAPAETCGPQRVSPQESLELAVLKALNPALRCGPRTSIRTGVLTAKSYLRETEEGF